MVFQQGEIANPKGRPSGYQSFNDRCKYLLGKYEVGQILEMEGDPAIWRKLPVIDAMILRRALEAIDKNGNNSMNSLLDRIMGKPAQTVAVSVKDEGIGALQDERLLALEQSLAQITGESALVIPPMPLRLSDDRVVTEVIIEQTFSNDPEVGDSDSVDRTRSGEHSEPS